MKQVRIVPFPNPDMRKGEQGFIGFPMKIFPATTKSLVSVYKQGEPYHEVSKEDIEKYESIHGKGSFMKYFEEFRRVLSDRPVVYDLDIFMDRINFGILVVNPAISRKKEICYPDHFWYVEDREAEAQAQVNALDIRMEAYSKLRNTSTNLLRYIASSFGLRTVGISDTQIKAQMSEIVVKGDQCEQFLAAINDNRLPVKIKVSLGLEHNVILFDDQGYYYRKNFLGTDIEEVINFFNSPNNSNMQVQLLADLMQFDNNIKDTLNKLEEQSAESKPRTTKKKQEETPLT